MIMIRLLNNDQGLYNLSIKILTLRSNTKETDQNPKNSIQQVIKFLGIELDTILMQAKLSVDKLFEAQKLVNKILKKFSLIKK